MRTKMRTKKTTERVTTKGAVQWDDIAYNINYVDDPITPEGEDWEMTGSVLGPLRNSHQTILWFWKRDVFETK